MGESYRTKALREDLGIQGYLKRQGLQGQPLKDTTPKEMQDAILKFKVAATIHPQLDRSIPAPAASEEEH
jgi:hypothetical protein